MVGHLRAGLECTEVEAGEPRVRAEQLHVERVVLSAPEHARPLGVPSVGVGRAPGILDGLLQRRPDLAQEAVVAAQLPVAVELHRVAELAVRAGPLRRAAGAERQRHAEAHAASRVQVVGIVRAAHAALELGIEEGQRLLVVPDMGAAALAAPDILVDAFPAVEGAIRQAHHRRRLQDAEVGGRGVEHRQWQAGPVERIAEHARSRRAAGPSSRTRPERLRRCPATPSRTSSSTSRCCEGEFSKCQTGDTQYLAKFGTYQPIRNRTVRRLARVRPSHGRPAGCGPGHAASRRWRSRGARCAPGNGRAW